MLNLKPSLQPHEHVSGHKSISSQDKKSWTFSLPNTLHPNSTHIGSHNVVTYSLGETSSQSNVLQLLDHFRISPLSSAVFQFGYCGEHWNWSVLGYHLNNHDRNSQLCKENHLLLLSHSNRSLTSIWTTAD